MTTARKTLALLAAVFAITGGIVATTAQAAPPECLIICRSERTYCRAACGGNAACLADCETAFGECLAIECQ